MDSGESRVLSRALVTSVAKAARPIIFSRLRFTKQPTFQTRPRCVYGVTWFSRLSRVRYSRVSSPRKEKRRPPRQKAGRLSPWSSHRACVRRHFDRTRRGDGPLCPFRPQKSSYHGRATFLLAEIPVTNKETWHFIALILSNITNYMKFKYFYCLWSLLGCHLTSIPFNFILYQNNHEEVKYKKQYHRLIHITIVVSVFKETFLIV